MSWIKTIGFEEAKGALKEMYNRIKGPNNSIDNVLSIHSLRPHTLMGHMTLYKSVLHNRNNTLPKWYLEALGVYVSSLNACDYCEQHHFAGFKRLLKDDARADHYLDLVHQNEAASFFENHFALGMEYARKLTQEHTNIKETDIQQLQKVGFSDGEILEINQVVSYFCYVNRMVVGLGVNTQGDIIGLSPNDSNSPEDWSHS